VAAVPGRPLNETEVEAYDVVRPGLARRVRLVRVPGLPGGYAGMTLGRFVLLARPVPDDGTSPLLAHELVHVRQWAELGVAGFAARYLGGFGRAFRRHRRWRPAYLDIGLEVQARIEATAWRRRTEGRRRGGSGGDGGEALP
jgi:hypothetical protein